MGCTSTDAQRSSVTEKLDAVTIQGTLNVPGVGDVPIDFRIIRKGQDTFEEESSSTTSLDMPPFLGGGSAGSSLLSFLPGGDLIGPLIALLFGGGAAEVVNRRRRKKEMPLLEKRQQILADATPDEARKIKQAWDSA